MFESLDERIELDEQKEYSAKQRMVHYLAIMAISVVVVGGLAIVFEYVK
jgi:Ni,Fe-hydrogenase I cytochrome b subunit